MKLEQKGLFWRLLQHSQLCTDNAPEVSESLLLRFWISIAYLSSSSSCIVKDVPPFSDHRTASVVQALQRHLEQTTNTHANSFACSAVVLKPSPSSVVAYTSRGIYFVKNGVVLLVYNLVSTVKIPMYIRIFFSFENTDTTS